jgi:hypothetical protein
MKKAFEEMVNLAGQLLYEDGYSAYSHAFEQPVVKDEPLKNLRPVGYAEQFMKLDYEERYEFVSKFAQKHGGIYALDAWSDLFAFELCENTLYSIHETLYPSFDHEDMFADEPSDVEKSRALAYEGELFSMKLRIASYVRRMRNLYKLETVQLTKDQFMQVDPQ